MQFGLPKETARAFKRNGMDGSALIVLDKKKACGVLFDVFFFNTMVFSSKILVI
jgi:hypothetical protein